MKIKITPIKSGTLCDKCKYSEKLKCPKYNLCEGCERLTSYGFCKCGNIITGTPCPDFVRAEGVGGAADEQ